MGLLLQGLKPSAGPHSSWIPQQQWQLVHTADQLLPTAGSSTAQRPVLSSSGSPGAAAPIAARLAASHQPSPMPAAAPQVAAANIDAESACDIQQETDQQDHSQTLLSPDSPPASSAGIPAAEAITGVGAEGFQLPLPQDAQPVAPPPPGSLLGSSASSSPLLSITDPDADDQGPSIGPPDGPRSSWDGNGDGSVTGSGGGSKLDGSTSCSQASSAAASSASVASLRPADEAPQGWEQAGGNVGRDISNAGSPGCNGSSSSGGSGVAGPAALSSDGHKPTSDTVQLPAQPEPTQQQQPARAGSATRRREAGSSDDAAGEPQPKRRRSSTGGGAQVDAGGASSHTAEDQFQPLGTAAAHVTAAAYLSSGSNSGGVIGSSEAVRSSALLPEVSADRHAGWQAPAAAKLAWQQHEVTTPPADAAPPQQEPIHTPAASQQVPAPPAVPPGGRASSNAASIDAAVLTAAPALGSGAAQPAVVSKAQLGDKADRAAGEVIGESGGRLITVRSRLTSSGDGSGVSSRTASADGAAAGGVHCLHHP